MASFCEYVGEDFGSIKANVLTSVNKTQELASECMN